MANLRSAKKRIRQNRTRRLRNRMVRTRVRSAVRSARQPAASAEAGSQASAALEAIRQLDKAASKGIIHRNNAARRKSRLLRSLRKAPTPR